MSDDGLSSQFEMDAPAGTVVFRQGEVGGSLYVVRSGRVRITRSFGPDKRVLATVGPGEFFGEMAVVSGRLRSATAEVVQDATLLKIRAEKLESILVQQPEVAVVLIRKLADRVEVSNRMIEALLHDDPSEKVITALNDQAGGDDSGVLDDTDALPEQLGMSTQEIDRVIKRLVRVGVLEKTADGLRVSDAARLQEFLNFVRSRNEVEVP